MTREEFEVSTSRSSIWKPALSKNSALIRWRTSETRLNRADEVYYHCRRIGLIIEIGEWILGELAPGVRWQKQFTGASTLTVSVNLSAKQLMHPALTARVSSILLKSGLNPRHLKLEVTESTVMDNGETALRVLSELRSLGISLSTDDFGTGYSSLRYLHRFPFQSLKIDRSFINRMDGDIKSEAIVRSILMLGQNLEIETVAEGIENAQQLWQLRSLGCRYGQGYLFSKPVNAAAAENLLREGLPFTLESMETPFAFTELKNEQCVEVEKLQ